MSWVVSTKLSKLEMLTWTVSAIINSSDAICWEVALSMGAPNFNKTSIVMVSPVVGSCDGAAVGA